MHSASLLRLKKNRFMLESVEKGSFHHEVELFGLTIQSVFQVQTTGTSDVENLWTLSVCFCGWN